MTGAAVYSDKSTGVGADHRFTEARVKDLIGLINGLTSSSDKPGLFTPEQAQAHSSWISNRVGEMLSRPNGDVAKFLDDASALIYLKSAWWKDHGATAPAERLTQIAECEDLKDLLALTLTPAGAPTEPAVEGSPVIDATNAPVIDGTLPPPPETPTPDSSAGTTEDAEAAPADPKSETEAAPETPDSSTAPAEEAEAAKSDHDKTSPEPAESPFAEKVRELKTTGTLDLGNGVCLVYQGDEVVLNKMLDNDAHGMPGKVSLSMVGLTDAGLMDVIRELDTGGIPSETNPQRFFTSKQFLSLLANHNGSLSVLQNVALRNCILPDRYLSDNLELSNVELSNCTLALKGRHARIAGLKCNGCNIEFEVERGEILDSSFDKSCTLRGSLGAIRVCDKSSIRAFATALDMSSAELENSKGDLARRFAGLVYDKSRVSQAILNIGKDCSQEELRAMSRERNALHITPENFAEMLKHYGCSVSGCDHHHALSGRAPAETGRIFEVDLTPHFVGEFYGKVALVFSSSGEVNPVIYSRADDGKTSIIDLAEVMPSASSAAFVILDILRDVAVRYRDDDDDISNTGSVN